MLMLCPSSRICLAATLTWYKIIYCFFHLYILHAFQALETNLNNDFLRLTLSPRRTLWLIAVKGLGGREVGTIEAADTLSGHFLVKTDPNIKRFADTSLHKIRKLKSKEELLSMESCNSNTYLSPQQYR